MVLRKTENAELRPKKVITSAKVVTWPELGVTWGLVIFGTVPGTAFWLYGIHQKALDLQQIALLVMLGIFAFAVIETFAIIILCGSKRLDLSQATLHWLGAATVGEISTLLMIAFRFVFHPR